MATPSRRPPVEVLTLASWVAVIGSAELKSDDGRSHFCSGCQRVGIDVDELLFSDGEPPLDFRTRLEFLVSREDAPRRLDRGLWLWALGHWQRLELEQRGQVLAARDAVMLRYGVPPYRTIVMRDGRALISAATYPEFPAVVARLDRGEIAELQRIRAEFRTTQVEHDTCPAPDRCSHSRVFHIWLKGEGSRVDDPALIDASSAFVEKLRQRLAMHFDIHLSSVIVRAVVERVVAQPRKHPKYRVRVERQVSTADAGHSPGSRWWVEGLAGDGVRPGDSVIVILRDALGDTTAEAPARQARIVLRADWGKFEAARKELAENGMLKLTSKE